MAISPGIQITYNTEDVVYLFIKATCFNRLQNSLRLILFVDILKSPLDNILILNCLIILFNGKCYTFIS